MFGGCRQIRVNNNRYDLRVASPGPTGRIWPEAASPTSPTVEHVQAMLPSYTVIRLLGQGGMGAVFQARQASLDRMVAIKVLPARTADDPAGHAERFRNEARTLARLGHPNIVTIHDSGTLPDQQLYFVMEFVDGLDLARMIRDSGRLPAVQAVALVSQVCNALDYAHRQGVIHRDIKPGNVLIDRQGQVKVADFGLAKIRVTSEELPQTRSNLALGTPDFVAPEMLSSPASVDHRADLYAIGVMLYQMLTGEVPRGLFKLPSQRIPGLDPRLDAIICQAMAPDPMERYQSAIEIRSVLELVRASPEPTPAVPLIGPGTAIHPIPTTPSKLMGQFDAPGITSIPAGEPSTQSPASLSRVTRYRWRGFRTPLFMLVGVGVLTLAVATEFGLLRRSGADVGAGRKVTRAAQARINSASPISETGWRSLLTELTTAPQGLMHSWRFEKGELRTPQVPQMGHETIELPVDGAPQRYDIRVRLTRHEGEAAVIVAFRR